MEKSLTDQQNDIASEPYKGPSAKVAAAGQGFIDHFKYAFAGLFGAGLLAFAFHQPAAKIITGARNLGTRLKAWSPAGEGIVSRSGNTLTNWAGGLLHIAFGDVEAAGSMSSLSNDRRHPHHEWLANVAHDKRQGFGNALLSHTFGLLPWVGTSFKRGLRHTGERMSTAITFGGAAGVVGYVTGWAKALFQGAKHGNAGKSQFEQAQSEIHALREKNQDLKQVNERLRQDYVEAASRLKDEAGKDTAASETPKEAAGAKQAASTADTPDKPMQKTHAHSHQGMVAPEKKQEAEILA